MKNLNLGYCMLCLGNTFHTICKNCQKDIICPVDRCPVCARASTQRKVCGKCLSKRPAFDRAEVLLNYRFPADNIIKMIKFDNRPELIRQFAILFAKNLSKQNRETPDILIPVPLHRKRQQQRGYNQSFEISRNISRVLDIKTDATICKRTKYTNPQSALFIKERQRNIKGAFTIFSKKQIPSHIALIDDVITSGATVNEIAKLLKLGGCQKVTVWVLARA